MNLVSRGFCSQAFFAAGLFLVAFFMQPVGTQVTPIPTVLVKASVLGSAYELDGVVQAVKQSTVSTQASGRIASLVVKAGDRVRAGQVLATIDDREASIGVQKSQAQINQADAELRNAQASWERSRDLQNKGFVSKAALDVAHTQYQGALAMREQAAAAAKQANLSQGFTKVTAPFDGWVLQTHADAGELAVPGKPLLTMYAPQPLRVVVQVPGSRSQIARLATRVELGVDGVAQWFAPVARTVVPSTDPVSQTTEWRLELPAKESANLVPGQQIRVRFLLAQSDAAAKLILPNAAVVRRGELSAVYVALSGGFSLRAVRLGASQGGDGVEVLAGVAEGEVVALDPIRAGFPGAVADKSGK